MSIHSLTLVSRKSALAWWQAEFIRDRLLHYHPQLKIHILGVNTTGDLWLDKPLHKIGGKGVFVKELEQALLKKEADVAVHSLKDLPAIFPEGLGLGAICERESPLDAWICPAGYTLAQLPPQSRIGTSSLRRLVQLKRLRPDLNYLPLRGNIDTRLRKCQSQAVDAIVLAVAGLTRLSLTAHIQETFSAQQMLPAVAQGALGIECRLADQRIRELLAVLDHAPTRSCILAERAMNARLGGNCQVPVAGLAEIKNDQLCLTGRVGDPGSAILLEAQHVGSDPIVLGEKVAEQLIQQGAAEIITRIMRQYQS